MLNSLRLFFVLLTVCPTLSWYPYDFVTIPMQQNGVIPDVVPANPSFHPQALLFVIFPTGPALLGNTLNSTSSLTPPTVSFTPMKDEAIYTIVMTDPDAPTRENQTYGQYRHWLATGVRPPKGVDDSAEFTQPDTTAYLSPNPPAGSGSHRYVLLLYREPSVNFTIPTDAIENGSDFNSRRNWNATIFAASYDLELVAANFFYVSGAQQ
ncbi:PEBP-like protein [Suillus clintonianus]|uniref:PEBP-like protein n=1 Tax=Suillus clintonianus TaxID=1904413 RepID=UPI001B85F483|nr:PEBP-like protein [Suillus clintonianus]KAG2137948.1 PEBP-like protein [Suillus clintonianus]